MSVNKARPRSASTRSIKYSNYLAQSVVLCRLNEMKMTYETGYCLLEDAQSRYSHWKDEGYSFAYDKDYLTIPKVQGISLTIPLREEPFQSNTLHPFFDGLIPEGWLLDIAQKNWKIDARDCMALLLACCRDCIGAVSIKPLNTTEDDE